MSHLFGFPIFWPWEVNYYILPIFSLKTKNAIQVNIIIDIYVLLGWIANFHYKTVMKTVNNDQPH
jgi:hypothetical protein